MENKISNQSLTNFP